VDLPADYAQPCTGSDGNTDHAEFRRQRGFVAAQARPAGGTLEPAVLISRKDPVHPGGDLQTLGGTVTFRVTIGTDGKPSNIRASDGPAALVSAALEAVKQWTYGPAKLNGRLVESETQVTLRFTPGR
jgi:TonB family protein